MARSPALLKILDDLNSRINPEKSRKFSPETFQRSREKLLALGDRDEFKSKAIRLSVVGTNGKGSTALYLSRILSKAGYRTGLYTSPHLRSPTERIRINGNPASPSSLFETFNILRSISGEGTYQAFTYFEILTLASLVHFKRNRCDVEIYEAGLGGRLDATRMAFATTTVLTSIGKDHTELLGDTLELILGEKLAIMGDHTRNFFYYGMADPSPVEIEREARRFSPVLEIHPFLPREESADYLTWNRAYARFIAETIFQKPFDLPPWSFLDGWRPFAPVGRFSCLIRPTIHRPSTTCSIRFETGTGSPIRIKPWSSWPSSGRRTPSPFLKSSRKTGWSTTG